MRTVAYLFIIIGIFTLTEAFRNRSLAEYGKDMWDIFLALVSFDFEDVSEVMKRTSPKVANDSAFTDVADPSQQQGTIGAGGTGATSKSVADLVALGKELRAAGFRVTENKALGDNPRPGTHMATGYHYKFDNSGAIDVNWPNASQEAAKFDAIVPSIRQRGFHVLWRVKGHYDHMHVDISKSDI